MEIDELRVKEIVAHAGQTVLVVDDEPTVRMLVSEVLQDAGYRTIEAMDGPTAMQILQTGEHIDLLITDVGLPGGMSGRQIADAARTLRHDLKVLLIMGCAEQVVMDARPLETGMEVLTKSFTIETIAHRVKDMLAVAEAFGR